MTLPSSNLAPDCKSAVPTLITIILLLLVILGAALRLYDLDDQPIDFHPTRQLRGAIIARGMYYQMSPYADEATRQQAIAFWASTGQYEPPILERSVALGYLLAGREIPWLARLLNTILWIFGGLAIFDLARRMQSNLGDSQDGISRTSGIQVSALSVLAFYLVLPFGVQASRSFQPDPGMVVWIILAAWAAFRWSGMPSWGWALLTGIFASLAILTKAIAIYTIAGLLLSLFIYTCANKIRTPRRSILACMLTNPQVWVILLIAVAPTAVYYSGRTARTSEFFSSWTLNLSKLLLQPDTYLRWLNLVQELLTPFGLVLALIGLILASGKSRAVLFGLWLGYIAYGLFLPYQMTTHSYYHLQLVPIAALSMVPVIRFLLGWLFAQRTIWRSAAAVLALVLLAFGTWKALIPLYSRDYRNEPVYWQKIASFLPENGKIIALTQDYGYRLMYYGWRKVVLWPNRGEIKLSVLRGSEKDFYDFFSKRIEGKRYFLVTAFNQYEDQPALKKTLSENFPILAQGNGYLIFDLLSPVHGSPSQSEPPAAP